MATLPHLTWGRLARVTGILFAVLVASVLARRRSGRSRSIGGASSMRPRR
jgi:hypothetical protein